MKTNSKVLKGALTAITLSLVVMFVMLALVGCGDPHSTYVFETDMPAQLKVGETYNFNITLKADKVREEGYAHARILLELDNSQDLEIIASDSQGHQFDLADIGAWGPEEGFELTPDYSATTPIKLTIKEAGTFTVTLKLVDLDKDSAVIVEETNTYTVS